MYAEAATMHAPANAEIVGIEAIRTFLSKFQHALPDMKLSIDYVCEKSMVAGEHVAIRWTIAGHHNGDALWGPATNTPVVILGESQYRIEDGRVVEEWFVYDDLAVLTQVERARLSG